MSAQQNGGSGTENADDKDKGKEPKGSIDADTVNAINSVVTAQLKKRLPEAVTEGVKAAMGDFKNELTGMLETLKTELPKKPEGGKPEPDERDKEIAKLKADMQTLLKKSEADVEAAKRARIKAKTTTAENELQAALTGKVRSEESMFKMLVRDLLRNVNVNDEEDVPPTMRIKRAAYNGADLEDVDVTIAEGVAHWLKQKDAEPFLPAPGPAGNGGKAPKGNAQQGGTKQLSDDPAVRTLQQLSSLGRSDAFSAD